jgi:hypothetical protein
MFEIFLKEGFYHILDPQAYDHIMFVIAICIVYRWYEWKSVLILVTAFTIGHSITLALASLGIVSFDVSLIETLIPITIIISAALNLFNRPDKNETNTMQYILAAVFGLIHGLGFSNYLRSILAGEDSIIGPLLAFNIGVELGQIFIVIMTMVLGLLITKSKLNYLWYTRVVLVAIILVSIKLLFA